VFEVLGLLAPLALVYCTERSSKAGFLRSRGVPGGPQQGLPWLLVCLVLLVRVHFIGVAVNRINLTF
jgi:hypothetical protein